jgi:signal transduction histidine kinase
MRASASRRRPTSRSSTPFYRAANVGAQVSGFGIGLYVVAEIIRRHAGQITVASQEGLGSTFRVSLPLAAQA